MKNIDKVIKEVLATMAMENMNVDKKQIERVRNNKKKILKKEYRYER